MPSPATREHHEDDPHEQRVDGEVLREATGDAGELAVAAAAAQQARLGRAGAGGRGDGGRGGL